MLVVVKLSGKLMDHMSPICDDVAAWVAEGHRLVIVHGASEQIDILSQTMGRQLEWVVSESGVAGRYTDVNTMKLIYMASGGLVNKVITTELYQRGVKAFGLSGVDGGLLRATAKDVLRIRHGTKVKVLRGNRSGTIESVNADAVRWLLETGYVPVIAPIGLGDDGEGLNVDGDRAAAAIAAEIGADRLYALSDVDGVLRSVADDTAPLQEIMIGNDGAIPDFVRDRMRVKVSALVGAAAAGVEQVRIGNGYIPQPMTTLAQGGGTEVLCKSP